MDAILCHHRTKRQHARVRGALGLSIYQPQRLPCATAPLHACLRRLLDHDAAATPRAREPATRDPASRRLCDPVTPRLHRRNPLISCSGGARRIIAPRGCALLCHAAKGAQTCQRCAHTARRIALIPKVWPLTLRLAICSGTIAHECGAASSLWRWHRPPRLRL